jgi:hypothetical protein
MTLGERDAISWLACPLSISSTCTSPAPLSTSSTSSSMSPGPTVLPTSSRHRRPSASVHSITYQSAGGRRKFAATHRLSISSLAFVSLSLSLTLQEEEEEEEEEEERVFWSDHQRPSATLFIRCICKLSFT